MFLLSTLASLPSSCFYSHLYPRIPQQIRIHTRMKPTTPALRHFFAGAAATVILSQLSSAEKTEQLRLQQEKRQLAALILGGEPSVQNYHHHNTEGLLRASVGDAAVHLDERKIVAGVLRNPPTLKKKKQPKGERCHPDLGVLACHKNGESCQRGSADYLDNIGDTKSDHWYCSPFSNETETMEMSHETKNALAFRRKRQQDRRHNRKLNERGSFLEHIHAEEIENNANAAHHMHRALDKFPPSGPVYDHCTYTKGLEYNYYSTIKFPSAWDRCACKGYNYDLPEQTTVYTDVDYCHKIHIYYCSGYYNDRDSGYDDPSSYDACLCSTYDEANKPIPNKPSNFCTNLPKRYCEHYFPGGDLVGVAKCLCDDFNYQNYCNYQPPPGFVPITQPTQPPTMGPPTDSSSTGNPTRSPTKEPTSNPTHEPTKNPTTNPTKNPTQKPTDEPTASPVSASPMIAMIDTIRLFHSFGTIILTLHPSCANNQKRNIQIA